MTLQGLADLVTLEVLRGMTGDGDIIIIDEELDVQALSDSQTSSLSIISFLLRTIGSQTEDSLVRVSHGDTVDHGPHVSQASRRELDTRGHAKFGVPGEVGVGLSVMEELLGRKRSFQSGKNVLSGDTMTGFVEEDGVVGIRSTIDETEE
jgi:hypothetical protein